MSVDWNSIVWYQRGARTVEAGPLVSINKAGRIILNKPTLDLFGDVPEAFQVGMVPGSRGKVTLVLQAAAKSDKGSLALSRQGQTKGSLNTAKFFNDLGLQKLFDTTEAKPEYDSERNALIVVV